MNYSLSDKQIEKWLNFSGQSRHAVVPVISESQAAAMGFEKFKEAVALREKVIANERKDRLRNGWEPPVWKVCDALLGLPCFDERFKDQIRERFGKERDWDWWCSQIRLHLGFDAPVSVLLISGPNRSGKSEYAAKRSNQIGFYFDGANVWCFSETDRNSIDVLQPKLFEYLPAELKVKDVRTKTAYVKYSVHDGFTNSSYVLENLSKFSMRNYSQKENTLEGPGLKAVLADELIPPNFQETLEGRIADESGVMFDTFTPIHGWSATVNLFQEGADCTKECVAFLLPDDGGDPDEIRAFGFENEAEIRAARMYNPKAAKPEDVHCWLEGRRSQPAVPDGRKFVMMPRVMRCVNRNRAMIYFQPMDNPFGHPYNVWSKWKFSKREIIERRIYGFARKGTACQLGVDDAVHAIDPRKIPEKGTNYMIIDPTPGARPWFIVWVRVTPQAMYVYREWPQVNPIAGRDAPYGNWAEPSGRKDGKNDGDYGDGAEVISWGYYKYLREIAYFEGWKEGWEERMLKAEAAALGNVDMDDFDETGLSEHWNKIARFEGAGRDPDEMLPPDAGARERIERRLIDSRAASSPRMENNRSTTLFEQLCDKGLDMQLAPGTDVDERVRMMNNLLDFEEGDGEREGRPPRLFVSRNCKNVLFCMQNWKNVDGLRGPMKDPCDCVGYAVAAQLEDVEGALPPGGVFEEGYYGSPY